MKELKDVIREVNVFQMVIPILLVKNVKKTVMGIIKWMIKKEVVLQVFHLQYAMKIWKKLNKIIM